MDSIRFMMSVRCIIKKPRKQLDTQLEFSGQAWERDKNVADFYTHDIEVTKLEEIT